MEITGTDKYLALLSTALENVLLPELRSSDAKATAQIMKQVLVELRKREHGTPRLLEQHIVEGEVIADHMASLLSDLGGAQPAAGIAAKVSGDENSGNGLLSLVETHSLLTERIVRLADALVTRRGPADDASGRRITDLLHKAADWERGYYIAQRGITVPLVTEAPATVQSGPLTRELLEIFLRSHHPGGERCTVSAFEPVPGGFSKQTFRITLREDNGQDRALIVRKSSPTPFLARGGFLIDREFHLLRDIHATGLPVAEPLYLGTDVPGIDGDFYVMTALPGAPIGSFLGGARSAVPETLLLQLAALLARMHSLGPAAFPNYLSRYDDVTARAESVESSYRSNLAEWRTYHARVEHLPSPYMNYLFDWLEQNIPRNPNPPVLVHGDYNIHNVIAEGDTITGILDWESAIFGAPEQDLSWIQPHVSRHMAWDRFVDHYRNCGGREIDEGTMNFCRIFSALPACFAGNKGHLNLLRGANHAIRYVMMELGFWLEFMNMGLARNV